MQDTQKFGNDLNIDQNITPEAILQEKQEGLGITSLFKKIRGTFFLVIGYLLSPLSWWNDLFFNLPVAYGFGYLCGLFSPKLFMPCAIAGYWLSNVAGILLMQAGAMDVFQNQPTERDVKKEILTGLVSSTVYTLIILTLIHFKILNTPDLFPGS